MSDCVTTHYDQMCCGHLGLAEWELNFEENIVMDINEIGWKGLD